MRPAALSNISWQESRMNEIRNQPPTPNPISQCRVGALVRPRKSIPQKSINQLIWTALIPSLPPRKAGRVRGRPRAEDDHTLIHELRKP